MCSPEWQNYWGCRVRHINKDQCQKSSVAHVSKIKQNSLLNQLIRCPLGNVYPNGMSAMKESLAYPDKDSLFPVLTFHLYVVSHSFNGNQLQWVPLIS